MADTSYTSTSATLSCASAPRWFASLRIREVARAVLRGKQIIALLEPNEDQGGLTERDCRAILRDEKILDSTPYSERLEEIGGTVADWSCEWAEPVEQPTPQQIEEALFASAPIIWCL